MNLLILIFISLSLGAAFSVSAGQLEYNFEYSEIMLVLTIIFLVAKKIKMNKNMEIDIFSWGLSTIFLFMFLYSIFSYAWTPYGLTTLPGALVFLYGAIAVIIASSYFNSNKDLYIVATRVFIISLLTQLFINFTIGLSSGVTDFYGIKDYATTFIGKSNFISFFITFDLLYEFIAKDKNWQFFFLLNSVALIATISRGAIVSLAFALVIYFLVGLFNHNIAKKSLLISYGFLLIVFLIAMLFTSPGRTLLAGLSQGLGASTVSSRQLLWNEAFFEAIKYPLGIGVVWKNDPHNFIFSSLRNLGVFVGLGYILLLVSPLFLLVIPKVRYFSRKSIAILIAYSSVVIHALIEVFYFTKLSVVWTAFTLVYIYYVLREDINKIELKSEFLLRKNYFFNNKLFEKIRSNDKEKKNVNKTIL